MTHADLTYGTQSSHHTRIVDENAEILEVLIDSIQPADSPRINGISPEHVWVLANSDSTFPPIVVHRSTMRVVDGMHRLLATKLRGAQVIRVQYFDGDAFVAAVQANTSHGLPLTLADRTAAATRLLRSHLHWSDRRIASITGLSAKLIASLRRDQFVDSDEPGVRIGRDGRRRPRSTAASRLEASRLFHERPDASVREIARITGISPATALDVRTRVLEGRDPVPERMRDVENPIHKLGFQSERHRERPSDTGQSAARLDHLNVQMALDTLRRDPALWSKESGRSLLRWLHTRAVDPAQDWSLTVESVPDHCVDIILEIAHRSSRFWEQFAEQLKRARGSADAYPYLLAE